MGKPAPKSDVERRIRTLENELWLARDNIIRIMTDEHRAILRGFYKLSTRAEARAWVRDAAEKILATADAKPGAQMGADNDELRAVCPLCGDGAQSPYLEGYAFPVGLHRHLLGEMNAQQCIVMGTAELLANQSAAERSAGFGSNTG
jgi:hypothetical protein